jgi:putative ABC transport system substrate-binding protein
MDGQLSFATLDYAGKKKRTKRGYVEGQNVTIEYRWAVGQYDRLPGMAAELVGTVHWCPVP